MNQNVKKFSKVIIIFIVLLFVVSKVEGLLIFLNKWYLHFMDGGLYMGYWEDTSTIILQNRVIIVLLIYAIYKWFYSKKKDK